MDMEPQDGSGPPPGVTLDAAPSGPPPGVTLDSAPSGPPPGVTLDAAPSATPQPGTGHPTLPWSDMAHHAIDILSAPQNANVGAVKEAVGSLAGFIKMMNHRESIQAALSGPSDPGAAITAGQAMSDPNAKPIIPALQRAMDWVQEKAKQHGVAEHVGGGAAALAMLMSPEALAEAGKVPEAMSFADHLTEAAKTAKILENHPVISRVVEAAAKTAGRAAEGAVRGGTEMGVQGLVESGGDTEKAAKDALIGAATGGVVGGGVGAVQAGREALSDFAGKQLTSTDIAGANFETTPEGQLKIRPPQPGTPEAASAAVDAAKGNIAKTAVANSINRTNATAFNPGEAVVEGQPVMTSTGPMSADAARAELAKADRMLNDRTVVRT